MFNLSDQDLAETRFSRDFRTKHNGAGHLTIQQQVNGLDVFGAALRVNVGHRGQVVNVGGELIPGVNVATPSDEPAISSDEAIAAAAASAGVTNVESSVVNGLVYFALAPGALRLAWDVIVQDGDTPNNYHTVVDATNSRVLWRENLTFMDHFGVTGEVIIDDGPQPSTPESTIVPVPPNAPQNPVTRDFSGQGFFPHDDPHFDWWNGLVQTSTQGNNVVTRLDRDGNNDDVEAPQPADDDGDFDFPLDLTVDPDADPNNRYFSLTNLFYWNNWMHDTMYRLGFDEAAGNFQEDNFELGGLDSDRVRADSFDGFDKVPSALCNAFFNSGGGDGNVPRMSMFLCEQGTPLRDSALDNGVIIQEFGHGIHGRLVPTSGHQRANEGWSDYFGISLLAEPGDELQGNYGVGH